MTTYPAEIDFEAIAVAALKAAPAVTALAAATDIGTRLPRGWAAGTPALRVKRIGGIPTEDRVQHLQRGRLQVESYAGTGPAAFALASAADLVLRQIAEPANQPAGVVVVKVGKDLALYNAGDPDSDSERYIFGAVLYAHRAPE